MVETVQYYLTHLPVAALAFWLSAFVAVGAAMVAAFSRRIVRAAFSLFFTLFALAGFFVLLAADFLAVAQVVVYVGGILALILFGVLLTNRTAAPAPWRGVGMYAGAVLAAAALMAVLLVAISSVTWDAVARSASETFAPTTRALGQLLLGKYLLPFEFVSITLLIALISALYLARRRDD